MAYAFFLALFPIFLLFGPRPALVGLLIAIVLSPSSLSCRGRPSAVDFTFPTRETRI